MSDLTERIKEFLADPMVATAPTYPDTLLREAAEQLAAKDAVLAAAKELCTDKWLSVGNPQTTYADGVADGREQAARDLRRVLTVGAS